MTIRYTILGVVFIFVLLIIFVYFSKKRVFNVANSIYTKLLILSPVGMILEFLCNLISTVEANMIIVNFVTRSYLIFIMSWTTLFSLYITSITVVKDNSLESYKRNYFRRIIAFICNIMFILLVSLPLDFYSENGVSYLSGVGIIALLSFCIPIVIYDLLCFSISFRKLNNKERVPMIVLSLMILMLAIINNYTPEVQIISSVFSFITIIMFFTIENPDVQMLEQVEFAKEQAERANKAKTDFLSSMSHEIRTPLNAIVGFSQSLKTEDLSPSAMEEVDDIIEASETLLDTVNGVLDISKIEANKIEIVESVYNFHKVFDELVALSKARLGSEKPITFKYELAPDTPTYLYGDYARVKQIVLNFLTNAIKYSNEGYIDFKVKNIINDGLCRLIITVEDSGIGIKKEAINKLFNKFERLDNENSTIEGTGLGLAITKKLVELMHGKIIFQSIYGKGSQFMVILDQKLVEEKDIPKEESRVEQTGAVVNYDYSSKKILIVDDNKLNLKVAVRLLKPYNVQTKEVSSGAECLDLIGGGNKYDLILMDDMMPKMSGKETFKKLKEDEGFNIPVVVLTANAITGMKEQYLAEGFNDYLAKPIERSELERVLRKYLG